MCSYLNSIYTFVETSTVAFAQEFLRFVRTTFLLKRNQFPWNVIWLRYRIYWTFRNWQQNWLCYHQDKSGLRNLNRVIWVMWIFPMYSWLQVGLFNCIAAFCFWLQLCVSLINCRETNSFTGSALPRKFLFFTKLFLLWCFWFVTEHISLCFLWKLLWKCLLFFSWFNCVFKEVFGIIILRNLMRHWYLVVKIVRQTTCKPLRGAR